VNAFERPDEAPDIDLLKIGREVELGQARAVAAVRAERDGTRVASALGALERACRGSENVMPPLIDACRALATEGEIVEAMVAVFGRHTETAVF
jgi:methylmalonyl-CoA mutase N-terminal domain/subunit